MNKVVQLINDFNRLISTLLLKLAKAHPNNASLIAAKNRFKMTKDILPTAIIDNAGFYLSKYRAVITAGDMDAMERMTENNYFDDEFDAVDATLNVTNDVKNVLPLVQQSVKHLSLDEKKLHLRVIRKLLSIYDEYLPLAQACA